MSDTGSGIAHLLLTSGSGNSTEKAGADPEGDCGASIFKLRMSLEKLQVELSSCLSLTTRFLKPLARNSP